MNAHPPVQRPNWDGPGPHQHWACEQPENPDVESTLYHADCPKCMLVLQLACHSGQGRVLMFHGASLVRQKYVQHVVSR